ncbi:aminotransferase class I/II-fold pyridoxal phosphate-dependent enzyme [Rhodopirellula sp. MGV]|uniref:aminotransferase class I/II-fold pyridoxal phosphate-dependent enzyme n=1 Tax=Rhodopirellula sp. MGV TaxID=2023130 RepID=UPI000B975F2E|nr:aminotransferase class I/II-fold pyridoxal phosphate-dependent enzyme [Rhodopirellula sp. MGV]OYP35203.1 fatty acyl-AMP ligase [Rhodopirellula sp. MGV]PNY37783.1 aminotransferase class V-fold PLP-dependent enzyme [Rhodopirellula baltica]
MDFQQYYGNEIPPTDHYVSILEHWAGLRPDSIAFMFTDVEEIELPMTYGQLWKEVRALAGYLQSRCRIRPGDRVLLLYPPGLDFIVGFFACHAAGAVAVPAFPPRKNRKASRIRSIVVDAGAKWALTTNQQAEQLGGEVRHGDLMGVQILGTDDPECRNLDAYRRPSIDGDTLAVMQYTSGSTGSPKGVMLTQRNLVANAQLIFHAFEPRAKSVGISWLPTYHDMGLVGGILVPVFIGCENVLMSPMTFLQRPTRWLRAISKYGGTITGGPNFAYQLCVDKISESEIEGLDLSSLQIAFNGAEPIRAATLDAFRRKFEPYGFNPSASLPCYGMAETTLIVTGGPSDPRPIIKSFDRTELDSKRVVPVEDDDATARKLVGCGAVLPSETVLIVDPDTREELPADSIGEIWVSSPSVGAGYYGRKEATERTFKAKTAGGDGPYLRTGDLGFLFDGQLYVSGRLKDMIVVRGVNRYPQDIEETVERASDVVQAGAVAAFAMDQDNREQLAIVAEVARLRDVDWDSQIQAIRRAVTDEHELPPDAVYLVRNSSVPKTSSGKIQRHACLHAVRDNELKLIAKWVRWEESGTGSVVASDARPMIQAATSASASLTDADVNPLIVQAIQYHVRSVAGERAKQLSLNTNIVLDLGLDSLERLEIARNLERTFGGRFPEQVLDEIETIGETAIAISRYLPAGADARAEAMLTGNANGSVAAKRPATSGEASTALAQERAAVEPEDQVEQFAEYRRLKATMEQMRMTGVPNPFFTVHDGIAADTTVVGGKKLISFATYNYLGMSGHPVVSEAAADAVKKYGTSVSASRLVSGEKPIHRQLEETLAKFIGVDDSILMVGGHATNETTIGHLVGEGDLILHDALSHNSIVQGALLSGARRRPFPHNDFAALDRTLQELRSQYRRVLIVIEGVYSMDGDFSNLPEFIKVKKKHRAMLMVDEAHSLGTMGKTGHGMAEFWDCDARDVDIWMGTLSKSAASCGGYIAGSAALVEYLRYTAPGFVFSVGMPPAQVAAALSALQLVEKEPERVERLRQNSELFLKLCKEAGLDTGVSEQTPVVPVITGNSLVALRLSNRLKGDGINVQPILYPAVEESAARLRYFITSEHSEDQIRTTVERTASHLADLGFALQATRAT